jgi:hypothetical protein
VSWSADDATYFFYLGSGDDVGPPWPAHLVEQGWHDELAAARRFGSLLCLTVHPWIVGRGPRVQALERVLRAAAADREAFSATCREIAEFHVRSVNRDRFVVAGD